MIKFLSIAIGLVLALVFTPLGSFVWANTISVVNPVAKETKVLNQLETQLAAISETVNDNSFASLSNTEKTKKINSLVSQASATLDKAQEIAEEVDVVATINSAVKKLLPGSDSDQVCD